MEESAPATAGGSRRAKKAAAKRASAMAATAASASSSSVAAANASSGSLALDAHRISGGGSAAFAPNVSRMRNFGRLKSFSSRQRLAPAMQKAAAVNAARNAPSRRWMHQNATAGTRSVLRVDVSGDTEQTAGVASERRERHEEEETKESTSVASVPLEQLQQSAQPRPPQGMRCLKLKCAAHPDLVMPYLYGDRKSRINSIMQETGCTIDYCPMSPDEEAQSPQSRAYIMNFLISAEGAGNLEEAIRMLRALVEKVEAHLQKKMRIRSLHTSAYRQLDPDRSVAGYSEEAQEGLLYAGDHSAGFVKVEANDSTADRMEQEAEQYSARARHPISPTALEPSVAQFRAHNPSARRRNELNRNARQDRGARLAVQYDDNVAYYDRWGRPVYRQELGVNGDEFEPGSSSEAAGAAPSRHPVSRLLPRRHWQYVDDSEWTGHSRSHVHVSPPPPSEDQVTSPSGSSRRRKASIHRRYAPYHHNDMYDDGEFDELRRVRRPSREGFRVSSFQAEERYSDFENEELLEHEEDIIAGQEYAIKSRAQALYSVRRGAKRSPAQFREVSPPPYQQKRAAPSSSSSHRHQYEYFDGHDGEWLSDDDEYDVVYRRYPRQPAVLYPPVYMGYHAAKVPRRRQDNFPMASEHPRSARPDSPLAEASKRRKMSAVSQPGDFLRQGRADADVQVSSCDVLPRAEVGTSSGTTAMAVHEMPLDATHDEGLLHFSFLEKEFIGSAAERRTGEAGDASSQSAERENPVGTEVATAADGVIKAMLDGDELMDGEASEGKSQQLQECAAVESVDESAASLAASAGEDAHAADDREESDQARALDNSLASGLQVHVSTSDQAQTEEAGHEAEHLPEREAQPASASLEHHQLDECVAVSSPEPQPTVVVQPRSRVVISSRIGANELLAASLRTDTSLEGDCAEVRDEVKAHLKKYVAVEENSQLLAQLDELSTSAYDLQCQVVSSSCSLSTSVRREMLSLLDTTMHASAHPEKKTREKVALLKEGIEQALALCDVDVSATPRVRDCAGEEAAVQSSSMHFPEATADAMVYEDPAFDGSNWDSTDGWFENNDDHYEMEPFEEQDATTADENRADEHDAPALPKKEEEGALLSPPESPSYATNLFSDVSSCSPTSFVMKGMQKRLFGEIERANSYYYLYPVKLAKSEPVKPRPTCEFGCSSGSAGGWVQKVTSQISSRMKWFDEITYSLARARSGGAEPGGELLNRKKMNSTIRKLHLMAIQLHCLVSHLYCVRGRLECREVDSLPSALNGSFFERRMTAYKSRLKLDADLHGTPEELLRDTFEFFPEFLLCIEMWGYDYREGIGGSTDVNKIRKSVQALPLRFFERVESAVFDYELDNNGFLQTICEELLSIVCLWNDFVWSDNLETLPVERIALFEAEMKKSVAKILQTYSLHLMGSWAVRLMANPDELQGLRFTQQNAYYAESNKIRGLASSHQGVGKAPVSWTDIDHGDDEEETVKRYWQLKAEAGGLRTTHEEHPERTSSSLLSLDAVERWDKETAAAHLLKWSRVFHIRGDLETCTVVLSDLVKHLRTNESVVCDLASADLVVAELLRIAGSARVVGTDVAGMSEMLALHSVSLQLPRVMRSHEAPEIPKEQIEEPAEAISGIEEPNEELPCAPDENCRALPNNQDVKDLIQILASTKKEVDEIFCARTRSGRVREKLQSQSVQLAQQTIDLFQNIITMRTE